MSSHEVTLGAFLRKAALKTPLCHQFNFAFNHKARWGKINSSKLMQSPYPHRLSWFSPPGNVPSTFPLTHLNVTNIFLIITQFKGKIGVTQFWNHISGIKVEKGTHQNAQHTWLQQLSTVSLRCLLQTLVWASEQDRRPRWTPSPICSTCFLLGPSALLYPFLPHLPPHKHTLTHTQFVVTPPQVTLLLSCLCTDSRTLNRLFWWHAVVLWECLIVMEKVPDVSGGVGVSGIVMCCVRASMNPNWKCSFLCISGSHWQKHLGLKLLLTLLNPLLYNRRIAVDLYPPRASKDSSMPCKE